MTDSQDLAAIGSQVNISSTPVSHDPPSYEGNWLPLSTAAVQLGVPSEVLQRLQELDEVPSREIMGPHGRMWLVRIDDLPPIHLSCQTLLWRDSNDPSVHIDPFLSAPPAPPVRTRRTWWQRVLRRLTNPPQGLS